MEDPFFDTFGKRYLPFAYAGARVFGLLMVFVSTVFWILGGWDSTVESTAFGSGAYGYGLHWSTVQTAFLAFYLIAANLQVGGFESLHQVGEEFSKDLRNLGLHFQSLGLFLVGRWTDARVLFTRTREEYRQFECVDPVRGFSFALLFAIVAGLLFELIWVPIYDFTNFGSWMWPVYYYGNPALGSPFLSVIFLRNNFMLGICAFFGITVLYAAMDGEKGSLRPRFRVHWRTGGTWYTLVSLAGMCWLLWVFFPHSVYNPLPLFSDPTKVYSSLNLSSSTLLSTHWIFPSQALFPQTEYTFYNSTLFMHSYPADQVLGFYVDRPLVHLANVVTKYATFAAVCYPAMVSVTRKAEEGIGP